MRDEEVGLVTHARDRREILDRVERHLIDEARIDHERDRSEQQGVPVGNRFRRDVGGDRA
jgi:hypothetical protein